MVKECRGVCENVLGAKKGMGNTGQTRFYRRCSNCSIYFPTNGKERQLCVCCGGKLRWRPYHKSRQRSLED